MKKTHSKNELDVDFIQSKPLTKNEEKALSELIKKLKSKKRATKRRHSSKLFSMQAPAVYQKSLISKDLLSMGAIRNRLNRFMEDLINNALK